MKNGFFVALVSALSSVALSGCATIVNGTSTDIKSQTTPDGATVTFNNGQSCTTPCKMIFKRKKDYRADIKLAGYKPTYVLVQSRMGGSTFGNILAGGIVGAVVDGGNGASNRLYPNPLFVKLAAEGSPDEAVLLDKDGKVVKTVQAHNDAVRKDVAKSIGTKLAGLSD